MSEPRAVSDRIKVFRWIPSLPRSVLTRVRLGLAKLLYSRGNNTVAGNGTTWLERSHR